MFEWQVKQKRAAGERNSAQMCGYTQNRELINANVLDSYLYSFLVLETVFIPTESLMAQMTFVLKGQVLKSYFLHSVL